MARRNQKLNRSGKDGKGAGDAQTGQAGNETPEPRALQLLEKRPQTSTDLATLMVDAVYDNLAGAISVGQGNLVLNMAGKLIQIKKLELTLGSMKKRIDHVPFQLSNN